MPKEIGKILAILLLGISAPVLSQSGESFPFQYDQYYRNMATVNPAWRDTSKFQLGLSNRSFSGLFSGVSRSALWLELKIPHNSDLRYSHVGLYWSNNRDGEFIQRNRMFAQYAWTSRLFSTTSVSFGMSLGMVQYSFQSSQAGVGGSDLSSDGNVGVSFAAKKWKAGLAWQQFLSPELTPLNTTFFLQDYWSGQLYYRLYKGLRSEIQGYAHVQYLAEVPLSVQLSCVWRYKSFAESALLYHYRHGPGILLGLPELKLNASYALRISASYLFSTRQLSSSRDDVLEFSVGLLKN